MKEIIFKVFSCIFAVLMLSSILIPTGCRQSSQNTTSSANATITVYFSQAGVDPANVLTNLYQNTVSTIDIAIYSFNHPEITRSLLDAANRGIAIRIISDRDQSSGSAQKQALNSLYAADIPVRINTINQGSMHLKMSIIDKTVVTLGSYNYTQSASKYNDEVLSVIYDPAVAADCFRQFERMWTDSKNYSNFK